MENELIPIIKTIHGETLGEIFKKFYIYINLNNEIITINIVDILKTYEPEDNLQKLMKLKLIDKWQQTSEIIKIYQEEDTYCIMRAVNCKWFFANINVDCTTLVNQILPTLSYSIRIKFIKQYSKYLKDVGKAEEIFNALRQRYGIDCACRILPACSQPFIAKVLHNTTIQVKPHTVNLLFKLYPDLIIEYILFILECQSSGKRLYLTFNLEKYGYIFKQFACKYPKRFTEMFVKYNKYFPSVQLGRRATKKIVNINKSLIIKRYDIFEYMINLKNLKNCLTIAEVEEFVALTFPKTMNRFFNDYWIYDKVGQFLSLLEENKRQEILLRTFKKVYGKELRVNEFSNLFNQNLINSLPTKMKVEWIQLKLPTFEPDSKKAEYLAYLPPDMALPPLKEMIVRQKEYGMRAHMVKCMLISCRDYKDIDKLVDCLDFILKRLRNDNIITRMKIFDQLESMTDILLNLPEKGWTFIEELINIIMISGEIDNFRYNIKKILPIKIHKLFIEGAPMEEQLKKFLDYVLKIDDGYEFDVCKGTPYQKRCLEFFLSAIKTVHFKNERKRESSEARLFLVVSTYNSGHKKDTLEYPEWLLTSMEKFLLCTKQQNHYERRNVFNAICLEPHLKKRIFTAIFPNEVNIQIIMYLLRKKPMLIKEHNDIMMNKILNEYSLNEYINFFKAVSLYTSFGLPQLLRNSCLKVLKEESLDSQTNMLYAKPNAITILSILMSTSDYIDVIKTYKPTKEQVDTYSDESRLEYSIQRSVASSLKYVSKPSLVLFYMKSIAVGDYLKLVSGSIKSICLKVAEKKIIPLLVEWLDCPVSLRKHFIRAYYEVAPIEDTGNLIVSLLAKEKNTSLRLLLLQYIYKFFLAEPSEENFNVFKIGFSQLTSQDVSVVDDMFDIKNIPDIFVDDFIKMLWEIVELKEDPLVARNKTKVINMIEADIMSLLSEEFCDTLLKHVFTESSLTNCTYITLYLLSPLETDVQMIRLDKVTKYITLIVQEEWNKFDLHCSVVFQARNNVFGIIADICSQSIYQKEKFKLNPLNLLEKLKPYILSTIEPTDIIGEILRLETTIFVVSSNLDNVAFDAELAKFCDSILAKYCPTYGDEIITIFNQIIPFCLEEFKLNVAKILLFEYTSCQAHLFAIKLIDKTISKDVSKYEIIINFLLKYNQYPFVKTTATTFLKEIESTVDVS